MDELNAVLGILSTFSSPTDCAVRLPGGETVAAVLDTAALRAAHGPIYGISIGRAVRVVLSPPPGPARIVWLEQVDD